MKLYGLPGACSLVDHIALNWIGKPFEYIPVAREALKVAPFTDISPLGAVPAIDDDGFTLTQNIAILEYLAEKHPDEVVEDGPEAAAKQEESDECHEENPNDL